MNKLGILCAVLALCVLSTAAVANDLERVPSGGACPTISPGAVQATPDMWYYGQAMQMYTDPRMMVRMRAEQKAEARDRRIESLKWFGLSNSRPRASSDPIDDTYSPGWSSNTYRFPYQWTGYGPTWMVLPGERVHYLPR